MTPPAEKGGAGSGAGALQGGGAQRRRALAGIITLTKGVAAVDAHPLHERWTEALKPS